MSIQALNLQKVEIYSTLEVIIINETGQWQHHNNIVQEDISLEHHRWHNNTTNSTLTIHW
jgi:hypothetical protein